MARRVDLLVVGGGPTGLAAGIAAARAGLEAVVLEPRPAPIDKACGEGLMPPAVRALADLGVALCGRPFAGIRYLDATEARPAAVGHFRSAPGLGVRRTALHAALWAAARAAGVEVVPERAARVRAFGDAVEAAGFRARHLIAADGLHSAVRRQLGLAARPRRPLRYGVRRHYAVAPWTDHVEVYFAEGAEAYVTPVARDCVGVAVLFRPPGRFDALLERFPRLRERLAGAAIGEDLGAGPFEQRVRRRVAGRILLAGDAAGYLDPITGEGIALGLAAACAAVASVAEGRLERYEARYRRITRRYVALTAALLDLARHRAMHRPLLGALRAWPALFDGALAVLSG